MPTKISKNQFQKSAENRKPAEVMIENGKARLIRKADVFEDLLRGQTLPASLKGGEAE